MVVPRRLWDACIVLAYLSGDQQVDPDCGLIISQAAQGELEIMVSTIAEAEVAYLPGISGADSEAKIREFFSREYVVVASFDSPVARIVRRLVRDHGPGLRAADAVHMATALQWHIPILETIDPDLLKLDGKEGNPPLIIRRPLYQGTIPMFPPPNPSRPAR